MKSLKRVDPILLLNGRVSLFTSVSACKFSITAKSKRSSSEAQRSTSTSRSSRSSRARRTMIPRVLWNISKASSRLTKSTAPICSNPTLRTTRPLTSSSPAPSDQELVQPPTPRTPKSSPQPLTPESSSSSPSVSLRSSGSKVINSPSRNCCRIKSSRKVSTVAPLRSSAWLLPIIIGSTRLSLPLLVPPSRSKEITTLSTRSPSTRILTFSPRTSVMSPSSAFLQPAPLPFKSLSSLSALCSSVLSSTRSKKAILSNARPRWATSSTADLPPSPSSLLVPSSLTAISWPTLRMTSRSRLPFALGNILVLLCRGSVSAFLSMPCNFESFRTQARVRST